MSVARVVGVTRVTPRPKGLASRERRSIACVPSRAFVDGSRASRRRVARLSERARGMRVRIFFRFMTSDRARTATGARTATSCAREDDRASEGDDARVGLG